MFQGATPWAMRLATRQVMTRVLAGAGAGEDQERAVDVVDGGALLGVQAAEIEGQQAGGLGVVGGAHGRF